MASQVLLTSGGGTDLLQVVIVAGAAFTALVLTLPWLVASLHSLQQDDYSNLRFLRWLAELKSRGVHGQLGIVYLVAAVVHLAVATSGSAAGAYFAPALASCAAVLAYIRAPARAPRKKSLVYTGRARRLLAVSVVLAALLFVAGFFALSRLAGAAAVPAAYSPGLAVLVMAATAIFGIPVAKSLSAGGFQDPTLPAGYYPFNVQAFGSKLYVTYAQRDVTGRSVAGAGMGYVSVFNPDGTFVTRLASAGTLNAPWGLAMSSASGFGTFTGSVLLVGNFGDGMITAFNPATGASLGLVANAAGTPLSVPGLWGITFGNDANAGLSSQLYFAAGPSAETHGRFGTVSYGNPLGGGTGGEPNPGY